MHTSDSTIRHASLKTNERANNVQHVSTYIRTSERKTNSSLPDHCSLSGCIFSVGDMLLYFYFHHRLFILM